MSRIEEVTDWQRLADWQGMDDLLHLQSFIEKFPKLPARVNTFALVRGSESKQGEQRKEGYFFWYSEKY